MDILYSNAVRFGAYAGLCLWVYGCSMSVSTDAWSHIHRLRRHITRHLSSHLLSSTPNLHLLPLYLNVYKLRSRHNTLTPSMTFPNEASMRSPASLVMPLRRLRCRDAPTGQTFVSKQFRASGGGGGRYCVSRLRELMSAEVGGHSHPGCQREDPEP